MPCRARTRIAMLQHALYFFFPPSPGGLYFSFQILPNGPVSTVPAHEYRDGVKVRAPHCPEGLQQGYPGSTRDLPSVTQSLVSRLLRQPVVFCRRKLSISQPHMNKATAHVDKATAGEPPPCGAHGAGTSAAFLEAQHAHSRAATNN